MSEHGHDEWWLSQSPEERPDIPHKQFRLLERWEMISFGNPAPPVGTFTTGVVRRLPKLSQYSRAGEVAVVVTNRA